MIWNVAAYLMNEYLQRDLQPYQIGGEYVSKIDFTEMYFEILQTYTIYFFSLTLIYSFALRFLMLYQAIQ